jgi:nucleotide-binding universal stress UspA family protein
MAEATALVAERSVQRSQARTIASVMVHVDFDLQSDNRIRIAANVASKFGAALIGVAGWVPGREEGGWFAAELERPEDRNDQILAELERLGEHFRDLAHGTVRDVDWRGSFHFARELIPAEARAADLVVISPGSLPGDVYRTHDPGTIILSAGRPVLVIPDGVSRVDAQRILIAWKDTREARRAVCDALPFLMIAKNVAVAIAHPERAKGVDRQVADLTRYLSRHGISVNEQVGTVADEDAGPILLQMAKQNKADLIVCGGYGRTRLSEWIFGGVTRHLLMTSTIPCLFSN